MLVVPRPREYECRDETRECVFGVFIVRGDKGCKGGIPARRQSS